MKLKLPNDKSVDLSFTKVMGTIALSENDTRSVEDIVELARSFIRSGAELLEIGTSLVSKEGDDSRVNAVLEAVLKAVGVPVAVYSNHAKVLVDAIETGAAMIITSDGLADEGVLLALKNSEVTVCLHCDPEKQVEDDADVVALISEFFFEKIDLLLNAGIARRRILIDPSVINASVNSRLRLIGRLESFKSFALPICVAIPRRLPQEDPFLKDNHTLALTTAIFCASDKSVQIIRTSDVSEVAIAIGFWQIMSAKTKPYRLSKAIVRRLRNMRNAISALRLHRTQK